MNFCKKGVNIQYDDDVVFKIISQNILNLKEIEKISDIS